MMSTRYPMLDLRCETESYQRCTEGMLLTQYLMHNFREHYLNHADERIILSPVRY